MLSSRVAATGSVIIKKPNSLFGHCISRNTRNFSCNNNIRWHYRKSRADSLSPTTTNNDETIILSKGTKRSTTGTSRSSSSSSTVKTTEASANSSGTSSTSNSSSNRIGLFMLLNDKERGLLEEQRVLLKQARQITKKVQEGALGSSTGSSSHSYLDDYNRSPSSSSLLHDILQDDAESRFSVVVAGEFNAGKSTLINALLGRKLLETGALPTTDSIIVITNRLGNDDKKDKEKQTPTNKKRYETTSHSSGGGTTTTSTAAIGVELYQLPEHTTNDDNDNNNSSIPFLQDCILIDTPGTNVVFENHTKRTMKLLPTADLIVFVTSADRPFPESEKRMLKSIQQYRKNIVVVINKMDILDTKGGDHGTEEKTKLVRFVRQHASDLLGAQPVIVPLSARDGLAAKALATNSYEQLEALPLWKRSNFYELETYLKDTLTTDTKIKSKLLNPIGLVDGMMARNSTILQQQQRDIDVDVVTLNLIQGQFEAWKNELQRDINDTNDNGGDGDGGFRNTYLRLLSVQEEKCQHLFRRYFFVNNFYDANQLNNAIRFYSYALFREPREFYDLWENHHHENTAQATTNNNNLVMDLLNHVHETADTIATRARVQGQAVIEFLGKRPMIQKQSLIGNIATISRFETTRNNLIDRCSNAIHRIVLMPTSLSSNDNNDYDNDKNDYSEPKTNAQQQRQQRQQQLLLLFREQQRQQKSKIHETMRRTAFLSGTMYLGALASFLSSGASIMLAATNSTTTIMSADTTTGGIFLFGSLCLVSGRALYTRGTQSMLNDYGKDWEDKKQRLDRAIQAVYRKEINAVERRILDGIAPYTRYVRTEQTRIRELTERSQDIASTSNILRNRIQKL